MDEKSNQNCFYGDKVTETWTLLSRLPASEAGSKTSVITDSRDVSDGALTFTFKVQRNIQ